MAQEFGFARYSFGDAAKLIGLRTQLLQLLPPRGDIPREPFVFAESIE